MRSLQKPSDKTLTKGLQILEWLVHAPRPMGVTELALKLKLTKSNVHRLIGTLGSMGYISQEPDRTYRSTLKVWRLGNELMRNVNLPHVAAGALRMLSVRTNETVHLCVLDGLQALHIEEIECEQEVRVHTRRGATSPLHCVAAGKILLAFNYDTMREVTGSKLQRYTGRTIVSLQKLDAEVARIRQTGLAFNSGEFMEDVGGIAAPIRDPLNNVIAAIGLSAPLSRLNRQAMRTFAPAVAEAGRMVSTALGASEH